MSQHNIVVIGASAGGLPALRVILGELTPGFEGAVLIAMHTRTAGNGMLPSILSRRTRLPVAFAIDREAPRAGRIYVAPPDFHLIVSGGILRVLHGPRENGFRPAIDPLFRTAAREWKSRVAGVILSGALADGTNGLSAVKHFGGTAIVQDPKDAIIYSMPLRAIENVPVDHVLPASAIGRLLARLGHQETRKAPDPMATNELEPQLPSEPTEVATLSAGFEAGARDAHQQAQDIRRLLFSARAGGILATGTAAPAPDRGTTRRATADDTKSKSAATARRPRSRSRQQTRGKNTGR